MEIFSTCGPGIGKPAGGDMTWKDDKGEGDAKFDGTVCGVVELGTGFEADIFKELIDRFDKTGPGRANEELLPHPLGDNP